jgi:hypothetical protein
MDGMLIGGLEFGARLFGGMLPKEKRDVVELGLKSKGSSALVTI